MTASVLAAFGAAAAAAGVRTVAGAGTPLTLSAVSAPFSIITYNVAFLPMGTGYRGREAEACRDAIAAAVLASGADIVGLCESWNHADGITERVRSAYPHRGPEPGFDLFGGAVAGAGTLLLSRHPFVASAERAYGISVFPDSLTNKGMSWVRIHPPGLPGPVDVFLTHTQNPAESGGAGIRDAQLRKLAAWVAEKRDPRHPSVVCGDLNFDGNQPTVGPATMACLGAPVDAWVSRTGAFGDGVTFTRANDFDKESVNGQTPGDPVDERLDFILTYPGQEWSLSFELVEVLRWRTASHSVSDHFGVRASAVHGLAYR